MAVQVVSYRDWPADRLQKKRMVILEVDDVDVEIYSLHYFIHLACQGETVALDMLHAPDEMIEVSSPLWEEIVKLRDRFYTKNLRAFIGYARRQAAKYGINGTRRKNVW